MWLTAPDLDCRPPAVIQCFLNQLEQTRFESCRRRLDAAGLVLVDGGGDLLYQLQARSPKRYELWERMLRLAKAK